MPPLLPSDKKVGSLLSASEYNRLVTMVNQLAAARPGSWTAGLQAGALGGTANLPPWKQHIVEIVSPSAQTWQQAGEEQDSSEVKVYEVALRYFNPDNCQWEKVEKWEDGGEGGASYTGVRYYLDASEFGGVPAQGDKLAAWWDSQRGMFVPCGLSKGIIAFELKDSIYPGGTAYDSGMLDPYGIGAFNEVRFPDVRTGLAPVQAYQLQPKAGFRDSRSAPGSYWNGFIEPMYHPSEIVELAEVSGKVFALGKDDTGSERGYRGIAAPAGNYHIILEIEQVTRLIQGTTVSEVSSDPAVAGFYVRSISALDGGYFPKSYFVEPGIAGLSVNKPYADWRYPAERPVICYLSGTHEWTAFPYILAEEESSEQEQQGYEMQLLKVVDDWTFHGESPPSTTGTLQEIVDGSVVEIGGDDVPIYHVNAPRKGDGAYYRYPWVAEGEYVWCRRIPGGTYAVVDNNRFEALALTYQDRWGYPDDNKEIPSIIADLLYYNEDTEEWSKADRVTIYNPALARDSATGLYHRVPIGRSGQQFMVAFIEQRWTVMGPNIQEVFQATLKGTLEMGSHANAEILGSSIRIRVDDRLLREGFLAAETRVTIHWDADNNLFWVISAECPPE